MSQVKHPDYYNGGSIEAWDYIKDHRLNFNLGNAIKYITRAGKKEGALKNDDLTKAIEYIKHELSQSATSNTAKEDEIDDTSDDISDGDLIWAFSIHDYTEPDIELYYNENPADGSGQYKLYIENAYEFTNRKNAANYLAILKTELAKFVLGTGTNTNYDVAYSDIVCAGFIDGKSVYEVYEKFRFFVDAFIRDVNKKMR